MNERIWYRCLVEVARLEIKEGGPTVEEVTKRVSMVTEVEVPWFAPEERKKIQERVAEKDIVNEMGANLLKLASGM